MSDNITKNVQRLNVQGKYFNVNTQFRSIELSGKISYKALKMTLLRKEIKKIPENKDNKLCYIANEGASYYCSHVPLIDDHPEIVPDKNIPSLALYLASKYPVSGNTQLNMFIYTYKDRPAINEPTKEYYGLIYYNSSVFHDEIYDNVQDLKSSLWIIETFGINTLAVYQLNIEDKKESIMPHLQLPEEVKVKYIETLYDKDTDFSLYFPANIDGGLDATQLIMSIILGIVLISSYYFINNYTDSYHTSIVNAEKLVPLVNDEKYLSGFKQDEVKNGAEKRLIYEQGKSEYIASYYSNLYSTAEIHENFNVMRALFPDFLAEWKLSKIVFDSRTSLKTDQIFFVVFDRIEGSIGVYDELDKRIESIASSNGMTIKAKELIKSDQKGTGFKGESRVYMVDFGYKEKLDLYNASLVSMDFLKERDKKIVDLSISANQSKANIYQLISDAKRIENKELIFGNKHLKIGSAIEYEVNVLKKKYKEIIDLTKVPVKSMPVPANTHFDEYKYISLKQRDSLFEWTYPALKTIYPNPQKIKKEKLAVFAKEFSFNLKSEKKLSLGYTYFLEAVERLNIPQIQIRFAVYDVITQSYLVEGRFFEQNNEIP